jgi:hypothetical protein
MKKIFSSLFILGLNLNAFSQLKGIFPFETQLNYFKAYYNGYFQQLEYVKVQSFQSGDNIVGYVDNKGDLKVFSQGKVTDLSPIQNGYLVSDNFLVTNVGSVVSAWSEKYKGITLTNYGRMYIATDSLVIFENTQQNAVNVYYNGQIYPLTTDVVTPPFPKNAGDNIVFYSNQGVYNVFYHGQTYELDAYQTAFQYDCGRDIAAFNDPVSLTFAIFENGQFLDLDNFHAKSFKCGIQCLSYVDNNGNLNFYSKGNKQTISNYSPDYWDAKDYMTVWGENTYFYVWDGNTKITAASYKPKRWVIKNNVVAFENQLGGVDCVINGKVTNIYNGPVLDFDVRGSDVLVKLPNFTYLVYSNGKKYME